MNSLPVVEGEKQPLILHVIISTETEKGFDKIYHSLIIKTLRKIEIVTLQFKKEQYQKKKKTHQPLTNNIVLNDEKLNASLLRQEQCKDISSHHSLYSAENGNSCNKASKEGKRQR